MQSRNAVKDEAQAFRLSRIYAEGWKAGRQAWKAGGNAPANPYDAEPDRTRWNNGFRDAK